MFRGYMSHFAGFALIVLVGAGLMLATRLVKKSARRQRSRAGSFGWVMLFLSSGRMPPPPPQSQIEVETREKKNREHSEQDH